MIRGVPYDDELEYLESTGSQYVDTGLPIVNNTGYQVEMDFQFVSYPAASTAEAWVFGYWGSTPSARLYLIGYYRTNLRCGAGPDNSSYWCNKTRDTNRHIAEIKNDGAYFDGVRGCSTALNTLANRTGGVWLFKSPHTDYGGTRRIFRCRMWTVGGELVGDYIPVRVGTTALMYDRVTRTFPKHYGTFVGGPVKSTPLMGVHMYPQMYCTASDYVREGLIGIWDAVENAGWGVHDGSQHPVNLVNGQPLSINGNIEIGDDYFKFGASQWGYSDCAALASAIASKDFSIEIVAKNNKVANAGVVSIGSRGAWLYASATNNLDTLNILSASYAVSPQIAFKSDDYWRVTIIGGATPSIIVNDQAIPAQYGTQTSVSPSVFYIGSLSGNSSWSQGTMWVKSVRLYSHSLSSSERKHNRTVDKLHLKV